MDKSTREKILEFINAHPGTHFREIQRELQLGLGTVQYHLYALEKEGKIVSRRKKLYKRFYPSNIFGEMQHEILSVLSQEQERRILLYLVEKSSCTQKELVKYTGVSASTINWHMKRLIDARLVKARREAQFVRYELAVEKERVLKLLKSYHPGIWERLADRLAEVISEITIEKIKKEEKDDD